MAANTAECPGKCCHYTTTADTRWSFSRCSKWQTSRRFMILNVKTNAFSVCRLYQWQMMKWPEVSWQMRDWDDMDGKCSIGDVAAWCLHCGLAGRERSCDHKLSARFPPAFISHSHWHLLASFYPIIYVFCYILLEWEMFQQIAHIVLGGYYRAPGVGLFCYYARTQSLFKATSHSRLPWAYYKLMAFFNIHCVKLIRVEACGNGKLVGSWFCVKANKKWHNPAAAADTTSCHLWGTVTSQPPLHYELHQPPDTLDSWNMQRLCHTTVLWNYTKQA